MPTNDFKALALSGTRAATQANYAANADLIANGFPTGVVDSLMFNKAFRQATFLSAVIGQFINDQAGVDALDDGVVANLEAGLLRAVRQVSAQLPVTSAGAANAYTVANATPVQAAQMVHGYKQRATIHAANTGATTLNVDGLGAKPVYGLSLSALAGGELPLNGLASFEYVVNAAVNGGNGAWILVDCTGGVIQLPGGSYLASAPAANDNSSKLAPMSLLNGSGRIIQAVHNYNAGSSTSSASYVSAHGASVNFTPKRSDSLIVGLMQWYAAQTVINGVNYQASYNVYESTAATYVAVDTPFIAAYTSGGVGPSLSQSLTFLHSPGNTTARAYQLRHSVNNVSGQIASLYIRTLILEIMP